jgi:hypothetical protein
MKHNFCYKLIGTLDDRLLNNLKKMVIKSTYETTRDFRSDVINVKNSFVDEDAALMEEFYKSLTRFFKYSGHMGTNIARMSPNSYVSEHHDYGAKTYGSLQDVIVKLQIPIITTNQVGMMWAGNSDYPPTVVHMIEGGIYIIDNVKVHSVVNIGSDYRYNLTSRWNVDSVIDPMLIA